MHQMHALLSLCVSLSVSAFIAQRPQRTQPLVNAGVCMHNIYYVTLRSIACRHLPAELGWMELRVGRNIMSHFLCILLLLIWRMYFLCVCTLYIVSRHNYMYYVCET